MEPIIDRIEINWSRTLQLIEWFDEEFRKLWVTLFSIIGIFAFCYVLAETWVVKFQLTGFFLEILGMGTVVYGLNGTLKSFERIQILSMIREGLKRLPEFKNEICDAHINIAGGGFSSVLSANINSSPDSPIEIDERFTRLEEHINQMSKHIEQQNSNILTILASESRDRKLDYENVLQKLTRFAVEGITLELMGITWLIFGSFFATFSNELAKLFIN